MAKRRSRARSARQNGGPARAADVGRPGSGNPATVASRVLGDTLNGVEVVAVGVLRLARDVLVTAVSGAANIGAEALTATTAGTRGIASAASRMVGDIAGTAQSTFRDTLDNARHARPGDARKLLSRAAPTAVDDRERAVISDLPRLRRSRPRSRRPRATARTAGARAAA